MYYRFPRSTLCNSPQFTQIYNSTIFKTFNNDIDKISAKWGILGRSFNEIGTAISTKISTINKNFQITDDLIGSIKNSGDSIWKRLYPSKESIKFQLIDIDTLYPNKTDSQFSSLLTNLIGIDEQVKLGTGNWQDYFNGLGEGEKWQIEFVQNTDLQKASLDDVKKAYNSAREAAIAHNAALQQQTLGAKAATVVTKALAVAGNMLLMWGISKVFEIAVSSINNYIHRVEKAREKLEETISEIESVESEIAQVNKQIDELLSQDALTITDENDLKRLQLENKELEARLKLLTAQKEAETKDLNEKIEKDYKRDFTGRTQVVWEGTGEYATNVYGQEYEIQKQVEHNRETYFYDCVEQLKAYAALERELTEQEKNDFEEKKQYIIDEGTELANLTEAYVPVTIAEQEMADKWNEMITSAADVANMYPGTAMDIVNHLNDKFAKISYIQNEHTSGMKTVQSLSKNTPARYDKEIQNWINSLNNKEQKIIANCFNF